MKAERINKNQIRFTLGAEDLQSRDIQISELSYGSEKAKALFQDMMNTAQKEFGFDFSTQPVMIEAVPLSSGSIMITVTKVNKPEKGEALIPAITTPLTAEKTPIPEKSVPTKQADTKTPSAEGYYIFGFSDFHTLRRTAALTPEKLNLKNALYQDPKSKRYYVETSYKQAGPKVRYTMNLLYENASEIHNNPLMGAYMQEHTNCVIPTRALQKLRTLA
ncbi:MAG: adaptor protein MecA [Firmicutes bacterium]|nr:adaptor protein MecA [Bacillota bacterium]